MKAFIRVAEVWTPSSDGTVLEHAGGCYDQAPDFGALSQRMCFGRGEGLPGAVWEDGCPQLWASLQSDRFLRARAAADAGLECALALPFHSGGRLTSVAVLFCAGSSEADGAVELWHNDARVTGDLRLADGYFSPAGTEVESLAREAWLPRGSGAPGLAWRRGAAVFIDDLGSAPHFLRAQAAANAGLVRALALPCAGADGQAWVVSLLSSARTPVCRRVEGWLVDQARGTLRLAFGFSEQQGRLEVGDDAGQPIDSMGAIGEAARSGTAIVRTATARTGAPSASRPGSVLGLPLPGDQGVDEVVALYL